MEEFGQKKGIHAKIRQLLNLSKEEQPHIFILILGREKWIGPAWAVPEFSSAGDPASGFSLCVRKVDEDRSWTFYSDEIDKLRVDE